MNTQRRAIAMLASAAAIAVSMISVPTASATPTVFGLRYMATSSSTTSVSWFKDMDATSYNLYVNDTLVRTVTGSELVTTPTVTLPQLLGPKDVVEAEAVAADGTKSEQVRAVYKYMFDPYDVFIRYTEVDFGRGSADLDDDAVAHIRQFVAVLEKHGFGEVKLIGHNAVAMGTFNGLTMASARADEVSDEIAAEMIIPTTVVSHGVKVTNGGSIPPTSRQVEIYFR